MSEQKNSVAVGHTPVPWAATTRRGSWDWVVYSVADPNIEICQPFHDGTEDSETGEANANLIVEAVNNHDRLTAQLALARKALEPFARLADIFDPDDGDDKNIAFGIAIEIGELRAARAALSQISKGEEK